MDTSTVNNSGLPPGSNTMPLRVLLADDSQDVRRLVATLLGTNPAGWSVCGDAADGVDALKKVAELRPDVVMLDLSIPKLSGVEVAKRLGAEHSSCAIILMSAHDPAMLERMAEAARIPYSVSKANLAGTLTAVLESILDKKRGEVSAAR